jgi:hypothetical protein
MEPTGYRRIARDGWYEITSRELARVPQEQPKSLHPDQAIQKLL